jgi:uncharacterized damage-inducible protein DinB
MANEQMIADWTRAKAGAVEFIEAMPEALLGYKPAADVFSFAEQFIHICWANYGFASKAAGRENPCVVTNGNDFSAHEDMRTSKAALLEFARGSYDFVLDSIAALTPEAMGEKFQFHRSELTRATAFSKALEHHAHHRGQCAVYFRLNGLKPPSERLF